MNQYTESEIRMMRVQALQGERSLTIVLPRKLYIRTKYSQRRLSEGES